ncbi:MAG: J domain-containing protein [Chloroflexota bacterium]
MDYKDYYASLGVPRTASTGEIRKAFRALARKHHPDRNAGDAEAERRFKEVNEANEVLADPAKRKQYDELGAHWQEYARMGSRPGGDPFGPGGPFAGFRPAGARGAPGGVRFEYAGDPGGFSDFFRTFFAGDMAGAPGHRRGGPRRPVAVPPVEAAVPVALQDAAAGGKRLIEVDGRRLEVAIPPGVESGSRIRLRGQGGGSGADARDLVLVVAVQPHPVFARDGATLTRDLPVTLREALLGAEVPVTTLAGKRLLLTIPAGTQPGRVIRLAGQGMPRLKGGDRGDLLVRVRVVLPALDEAGRAAATAVLDAIDQPDPRQGASPAARTRSTTAP